MARLHLALSRPVDPDRVCDAAKLGRFSIALRRALEILDLGDHDVARRASEREARQAQARRLLHEVYERFQVGGKTAPVDHGTPLVGHEVSRCRQLLPIAPNTRV